MKKEFWGSDLFENGNKPTAQEIFDVACERLRNQKKRCTDDNFKYPACVYHKLMKDGKFEACIAGFFIPQSEYVCFGGDFSELLSSGRYANKLPDAMFKHEELFMALQKIHDSARNWDAEGFRGCLELKSLADTRNLIYNENVSTAD